eukprot:COSAG02_NODE_234_length_27784_cov_12.556872_18_plen_409_part_00
MTDCCSEQADGDPRDADLAHGAGAGGITPGCMGLLAALALARRSGDHSCPCKTYKGLRSCSLLTAHCNCEVHPVLQTRPNAAAHIHILLVPTRCLARVGIAFFRGPASEHRKANLSFRGLPCPLRVPLLPELRALWRRFKASSDCSCVRACVCPNCGRRTGGAGLEVKRKWEHEAPVAHRIKFALPWACGCGRRWQAPDHGPRRLRARSNASRWIHHHCCHDRRAEWMRWRRVSSRRGCRDGSHVSCDATTGCRHGVSESSVAGSQVERQSLALGLSLLFRVSQHVPHRRRRPRRRRCPRSRSRWWPHSRPWCHRPRRHRCNLRHRNRSSHRSRTQARLNFPSGTTSAATLSSQRRAGRTRPRDYQTSTQPSPCPTTLLPPPPNPPSTPPPPASAADVDRAACPELLG